MLDYLALVRHGLSELNVLFEILLGCNKGFLTPKQCRILKELWENGRGELTDIAQELLKQVVTTFAGGSGRLNKLTQAALRAFLRELVLTRPDLLWRLTDTGLGQIDCAGEWLRENMPRFDRHYVSDYLRTLESAVGLKLPGRDEKRWWLEANLRERIFGDNNLFLGDYEERCLINPRHDLLAQPRNGESYTDLILRGSLVYNPFHWEDCVGKSAIMVCHEEMIKALMIRIERITQDQFSAFCQSQDACLAINNAQIIVYSSVDPESGEKHGEFHWKKSICPWDMSRSLNSGEWIKFMRPTFSDQDLMAMIQRTPRLVNS